MIPIGYIFAYTGGGIALSYCNNPVIISQIIILYGTEMWKCSDRAIRNTFTDKMLQTVSGVTNYFTCNGYGSCLIGLLCLIEQVYLVYNLVRFRTFSVGCIFIMPDRAFLGQDCYAFG